MRFGFTYRIEKVEFFMLIFFKLLPANGTTN